MSPIDDTVISGSLDKTIRLWDLRSPNCHVSELPVLVTAFSIVDQEKVGSEYPSMDRKFPQRKKHRHTWFFDETTTFSSLYICHAFLDRQIDSLFPVSNKIVSAMFCSKICRIE